MSNRSIGVILSVAFAALIAAFIGASWFELDRMRHQNDAFDEVVNKRFAIVHVANEAAELHLDNARLTLHLVLLDTVGDGQGALRIASQMSANSARITTLMQQLDSMTKTPHEREILSRVQSLRTPYLEARARAQSLFTQSHTREAMAVVSDEMMPTWASTARPGVTSSPTRPSLRTPPSRKMPRPTRPRARPA